MPRLIVLFFWVCVFGTTVVFGQARQPWTASRIVGTPEPAKAFVAEQVRPELSFAEALELAGVPGTERLLLVERRGRISSFSPAGGAEGLVEVLDLKALHPRLDHAYGVVLSPRWRETREIFVCYAMPEGQPDGSRVSRFTLSSLEPLRADPQSEEIVISWIAGGHNGGSLQFGPDGYLYISTGDSGPAAPPDLHNTGQAVHELSAAILRIDIAAREAGKSYRVPPDNPWVGREGVRPELWAFGLRNPWKMSFDRATGALWCGDIGWELWEMVHLIRRGANYGWAAYEASQPIKPHTASPLAPVTPPVVAHPHSEAASITGGFVYHGKLYPELAGAYVYGDYATGKVWALWHDGKQIVRHEEIADTPHAIIAFGQDEAGELYYLHYAGRGTLHRLVRNPKAGAAAAFPRKLSETGLFAEVARQAPAAGVREFAIGTAMWQDGASARRWIALPERAGLETTARRRRGRGGARGATEYATKWPAGAVLARTLTLGALAPTEAEREKPVETQVLHYDGETWQAYSYRWDDAGVEAELVPAEGAERTLRAAADPNALGPRTRDYTWRFASRAECLRCHNSWHNGALAFTPTQLRGGGEAQLRALVEARFVDENFAEQVREATPEFAGKDGAARAWLHANCASCHTQHAGGSVALFLNAEMTTEKMNVVGVAPTQGGFGLKEPKIVAPGEPWNSVLALRVAKMGSGHMPLIGSREIDVTGVRTIEDWIAGLGVGEKAAGAERGEGSWDRARVERELGSVSGAMRVRRAIDDGKLAAKLREAACRLAWESPEATVRDIFERFKPDELRDRTLGAVVDVTAVLRLKGDAARGAKLVTAEGKLGSCQACHMIQGQGRHFGPELSRVGAQQMAAQILESIVAPSKTIAPLYRTTVVKLRDGTTHAGFVRARAASELVLAVPGGQTVKVKLAEIVSEETQLASLMPEGLLAGITAQEAADLVAYLAGLK